MTGVCPACGAIYVIRSSRGSRLRHHRSACHGEVLVGVRSAAARRARRAPIEYVVGDAGPACAMVRKSNERT